MPFLEDGAESIKKNIKKIVYSLVTKLSIRKSKYIIVCIGTPVNKNLKPETKKFLTF